MKIKYLWTIFILFAVYGCKDAPEQIPAYLHIDPFVVNEQGGAGWQNIRFAWLYAGTEFLGAYTLPANVPLLKDTSTEITLFTGINENGITSAPDVYYLLTKFVKTVDLKAGKTTNIQPTTRYDPNATILWKDEGTFDAGAVIFFDTDGDAATSISVASDSSFSGNCAKMKVDTLHPTMTIASQWVNDLPIDGVTQCWLEITYHNDAPFELWILGQGGNNGQPNSAQPVFQFSPNNKWKKTYFNLTDYLGTVQNQQFAIQFNLSLPKDIYGKVTQNSATARFDNIKILHF